MNKNMMTLKGAIVANNMTQEDLANEIGITRSTLYRKMMTDGREFTAGEIRLIQEVLGLTIEQVCKIFLT